MATTCSKQEYFARLYALKDESDDEDHVYDDRKNTPIPHHATITISITTQTPTIVLTPPARDLSPVVEETPKLKKTEQLTIEKPIEASAPFVAETPLIQRVLKADCGLKKRSVSHPAAPTSFLVVPSDMTSIGKTRKKDPPINLVPVAQRVFKDCTMYWIPNNDINPARRMRIRSALEHGAIWSRELNHQVTHILVDGDLEHKELLDYLKMSSIPPQYTVVNDKYRVDCIIFGATLDPAQHQYRIKGYIENTAAPHMTDTSIEPPAYDLDQSLELKAPENRPGKWDFVPPKSTPPRSEDSAEQDHNATGNKSLSSGTSFESHITSTPILQEDVQVLARHSDGPQEVLNSDKLFAGKNALAIAINEIKSISHLPLFGEDDDEDAEDNTLSKVHNGYIGSDSDTDTPPAKRPAKYRRKNSAQPCSNQNSFSCMKGGNGRATGANLNDSTITILSEMADYYERINDHWRLLSYRKAVAELRRQTTKITTFEEAFALTGVGERLARKIEEIAATNRLRRLENALAEPDDESLQIFTNVYGVGLSQASKWVAQGHRTLQDLLEKVHLTENQRLGIEHYDDFLERIPRFEVTALGATITKVAFQIDPKVEIIIGGSYRRGALDSGDIDCIITKEGTSKSSEIIRFLHALTDRLTRDKFLVAALAVPHGDSGSKWHGCCVLPPTDEDAPRNPWRRIDFLLVPGAEIGAALIYFTGNDIFNRSIRLLASKKGMRLNQRGLYQDVMRGPSRVKLNAGELLEGADERRIFELLGVPWREPKDRIC